VASINLSSRRSRHSALALAGESAFSQPFSAGNKPSVASWRLASLSAAGFSLPGHGGSLAFEAILRSTNVADKLFWRQCISANG